MLLAERFGASSITTVSNSAGQRRFIEARASERDLSNLIARTADVNEFSPTERFDRVVSIEMFEHLRNWAEILRRIAGWLEPGRVFLHHFCHRTEGHRAPAFLVQVPSGGAPAARRRNRSIRPRRSESGWSSR